MNNTSPILKAFKRSQSLEFCNWYMGSLTTNRGEKNDTNGAFCLVEAILAPGHETPPHVHSCEDELFYVLEGEFDVYAGEEAYKCEAGDCIFLPRFKPHAFLISSLRFRVLTLFTPRGFEEALRCTRVPAESLELPTGALNYSTADLKETAQRLGEYGIRFLTPEEIANQLPLYSKTLPQNSRK